jgi:hypothetical protein
MVQVDESAGDASVPGSTSSPVLPERAGALAMGSLIDLYTSHYEGRDPTRGIFSKREAETGRTDK